ncbi:MAG: RluA family pseudouridine synthase [Rhodospirillaceae bacterium]
MDQIDEDLEHVEDLADDDGTLLDQDLGQDPVGTEHRVTVPADSAPVRMDKWLGSALESLSRARIRALIEAGQVRVDGVTIFDPARKVQPGMDLCLIEPPPIPAKPEAEAIPLTILYEDDALLVLDKPPGLVVHPAPGNSTGTLVNALLHHCGKGLSGIGGERRPGIVHRLDKDTSGLMVVAKSDAAHRGLAEQFAVHSLDRIYHAVVWGRPGAEHGTVDAAIGRDPKNRKRMAVIGSHRAAKGSSGGKHAITHWRLHRRFPGDISLLECRLATGRTHQVRVHMAHMGNPLLGDPLYGRRNLPKGLHSAAQKTVSSFLRQALHSREIGFIHPIQGHEMRFIAEYPNDISTLINSINSR